jgi:hypothetical protein
VTAIGDGVRAGGVPTGGVKGEVVGLFGGVVGVMGGRSPPGGVIGAVEALVKSSVFGLSAEGLGPHPCNKMPPNTTTCTAMTNRTLKNRVDLSRGGKIPWGRSGLGVFITFQVVFFRGLFLC